MESQIVRGHHSPEKRARAQRMRREMTWAETLLWRRLRNNQLLGLPFRRQQVIDGFIADFYCRKARLVIECDGAVHAHQAEYDRERDRILATHNLRILRFTNQQIETNLVDVLRQIATMAQEALTPSPAPITPSLTGRGGELQRAGVGPIPMEKG